MVKMDGFLAKIKKNLLDYRKSAYIGHKEQAYVTANR